MDGHSAPVFLSSNEVAVHASKTSACFERESVGIWNPCLMDQPLLTETYRPFLSNKGVSTPPWITTVDTDSGRVQVPIFQGMAKNFPVYTPPTHLPCPSTELRGSLYAKERNLFSFGVGGMGSGGSMSHGLASCQAQSNRFDVQLSEVCQRRFVMFDRSGTKRRVIFHPAVVNDLPALLPSSLLKSGAYNSDPPLYKSCDARGSVAVASPFVPSTTPLGPYLLDHDPHLLLKNSFLDSHSSASYNGDTPLLLNREITEVKWEENGDGSPELSGYLHENTEDIEALLSSDEDEVSSTGHSPIDLSWNEGHSMSASKKRKRETEILVDDDDTCSSATLGFKVCKGSTSENVCDTGINMSYGQEGFLATRKATTQFKDLGYGKGDLTAFDMFFPDEISSSSSANNLKWENKLPSMRLKQQEQQQQQEGQSRKEKIKSILRLLRGVIPGGESMDAAFVLDEAIQYVKTLQFEVQKLQAKKLT